MEEIVLENFLKKENKGIENIEEIVIVISLMTKTMNLRNMLEIQKKIFKARVSIYFN